MIDNSLNELIFIWDIFCCFKTLYSRIYILIVFALLIQKPPLMTLIYALFPQATSATIRKSKQTNPENLFWYKSKTTNENLTTILIKMVEKNIMRLNLSKVVRSS